MPTPTYTLITSTTLTADTASVTFSSIPGTYTDLIIRLSARGDNGGTSTENIKLTLNSDTATNYSITALYATGTTPSSNRNSSQAVFDFDYGVDGSTATSNTFSSAEIYIPSYIVSQNKPLGIFSVAENNSATGNGITDAAGLWRNTAAITSISISPGTSAKFKSTSSFFLYGIKNS